MNITNNTHYNSITNIYNLVDNNAVPTTTNPTYKSTSFNPNFFDSSKNNGFIRDISQSIASIKPKPGASVNSTIPTNINSSTAFGFTETNKSTQNFNRKKDINALFTKIKSLEGSKSVLLRTINDELARYGFDLDSRQCILDYITSFGIYFLFNVLL